MNKHNGGNIGTRHFADITFKFGLVLFFAGGGMHIKVVPMLMTS